MASTTARCTVVRQGRPAARLLPALLAAMLLVGCSGGDPAPEAGFTQDTESPTAEAPPASDTESTTESATLDPTAESPSPAAASTAATTAPAEGDLTGELVVLAASSLAGVFTTLGEQLETQNPELTVTFSFAASSALAAQVAVGAPADVLATANRATMTQVSHAAPNPVVFATNTLTIVTPPGNPAGITGLADFADPNLRIAVCAVEVPCGAAAARVFAAAGVTPAVDTYAANVSGALTLARTGEVDAALVYTTDAAAARGQVTEVTTRQALVAVNEDMIATLRDAQNPDAARAFVALVTSPAGATVLRAAGFVVQ